MEPVIAFLEQLFQSFDSRESLAFAAFVLGAFLLGLIFAWLIHGTRARRRRKANDKLRQQLLDREAQEAKLREEVQLKDADLEKLRLELQQQQTANTELRAQYDETARLLHQRTEENERLQANAHAYNSNLESLNAQLVALQEKADNATALGTSTAEGETDDALFRLQQLELRMEELEQANEQLGRQLTNMEDQTGDLGELLLTEDVADELIEEEIPVGNPAAAQLVSIETEVTDLDARDVPLDLPDPEALVPDSPAPVAVATPVGAPVATAATVIDQSGISPDRFPHDDLTRIKGIGPFIEQQLNDIGITSFQQLAAMDDRNIREVTKAIGFFEGRIKEDDWVGQATKLAAEAGSSDKRESVDATDLTIVSGIGDKMQDVLRAGGIRTLPELANTSAEQLNAVLEAADQLQRASNPGTWSQQAQMAIDGKLKELREFKSYLGESKVK